MGKALTLVLFLFFLLFNLPFAYASENQFLVNDPDLYSPLTWSYGIYQANSSESYVMHDSDNHLFKFHVADNLSDDSFGWGFLHQGVQLHSWGLNENKPLKSEFLFERSNMREWILNITLKRSAITWFDVDNSSIPDWLAQQNGKGQVIIGCMFAFETSNQNYMADPSESCVLQFEIQFLRVRWDGEKEIALFDDFFKDNGTLDYDVHNIFVPYGDFKEHVSPSEPLKKGNTITYVVQCDKLFKFAWDRWRSLFDVENARLKYVNFYVETLNAEVDCTLESLNVYVKPETNTSVKTVFMQFGIALFLIFLVIVVIKITF